MGFAENMRIMSNINCGLASLVSYGEQRTNGVNPQYAAMNLFGNLANGISRNEVAYEMQKQGNSLGNMVNMYSGYGDSIANTLGTLRLMSVCNPWMFFNSYQYMPPVIPMRPMVGGFYANLGLGFNNMTITTTTNCHHHRGFCC